ncbi:MAG: hypothetical protein KI793_12120 [Rivularia sp. (in: Bacteria)]|nr:hypothetical protein [Rivularia sp. MS3]
MAKFSRFNQVLESIETLSLSEQEALIQVVRQRLVEKRRDEIAVNIAQAQFEYAKGEVFRGTVSEIMDELDK